jgi:signal transduction histidine kinase
MKKLLGIMLIILLNLSARANFNDTIVFNTKSVLSISDNVYIYKDTSIILKYKDVSISSFTNNFKSPKFYTSTYNTSNSAYWLYFNIKNNTGENIALMIDYPMLDTVQYYGINRAGVVDSFYSGTAFPYSQRQIDHNRIIFELKPEITTVYLRVRSSFNLQLPLTIYSFDTLNASIGKENFYQGCYFGFVLLIIIYSTFVYFSSRDAIYLYYLLHVGITGLIMAHISGYTFQNIWPNMPLINKLEPTFFGLSAISLLFSMRFLETKTNTPSLHKWYCYAIGLTLLAIPLNLLNQGYLAMQIVQAASILGCVLMFTTGLVLMRRGYKPARHFTFAWSFLLGGTIITLVQRFGLLPYKWYFTYAWQIGSAFDIIFLSLAVADRITLLREKAQESQLETLQHIRKNEIFIREQNQVLAQKIRERTNQLEEKNNELQKLNNTKDKLFSILAHDLKGPIGNIHKFIEMMIEDDTLRDDETLIMLKGSAANTYNLLDNLLTWACSQRGEIEFNPERLNLNEVIKYPTGVLNLQMLNKNIVFKNTISDDVFVLADMALLRTILRNILSNAIKFTQDKGTITISTNIINTDTVQVCIADTGVGIEENRLTQIFEPVKNKNTKGTAGEKGTGLGLLITAEFVELCHGEITATSIVGQGTTVCFSLPIA